VGSLVTEAVQDFFSSGFLLKEVNATILALIPKVPNACEVNDFRPIACCNTVYKLITKILANRIAPVLQDLISPTQNAFVKGRRIRDNILLAQELFAGFHLDPYLPRCAVKVDFRKAYDTIDWDFLELTLTAFRFPQWIITRIMACVRTPRFSISINGELHGFFPGGRGLRQGDPMSPYLFTLIMEIFSGILNRRSSAKEFKYFWRCKSSKLTHLFFADDVFLFCQADWKSATILKRSLDIFSSWSGLLPNKEKSDIFLSGGDPSLRSRILLAFGFQEGKLPVRYLGVPIISKRLSKGDCVQLIDRITSRVRSWSHRFLSFAGRLQLIRSVLHAIQSYWTSVFTLPASVILGIENILRRFLWKGTSLATGGVKVAWADICLPREEGGLGIRSIKDCNKASMLKYIWILFTDKESLWCRWIHSNFLKKHNFWVAQQPSMCAWSWKKILQLRGPFRQSFGWEVGNGHSISLWFDNWLPSGPLHLQVPEHFVSDSDVPTKATVAFLYSHTGGSCKRCLEDLGFSFPSLSASNDRFVWHQHASGSFSVASAWNFIRISKARVPWTSFVWDKDLAPRFQFLLWLTTKRRLPTQAFLLSHGRIDYSVCTFCNSQPDSIDHLYFGCNFPATLVYFWATRCNLPWRNGTWEENLDWARRFLAGKDFFHSLSRYSFGALCYLIWKKRNAMIFQGDSLDIPTFKNCLIRMVKEKTLTYRDVPDTPRNRRLQRGWGFDPAIFV